MCLYVKGTVQVGAFVESIVVYYFFDLVTYGF